MRKSSKKKNMEEGSKRQNTQLYVSFKIISDVEGTKKMERKKSLMTNQDNFLNLKNMSPD